MGRWQWGGSVTYIFDCGRGELLEGYTWGQQQCKREGGRQGEGGWQRAERGHAHGKGGRAKGGGVGRVGGGQRAEGGGRADGRADGRTGRGGTVRGGGEQRRDGRHERRPALRPSSSASINQSSCPVHALLLCSLNTPRPTLADTPPYRPPPPRPIEQPPAMATTASAKPARAKPAPAKRTPTDRAPTKPAPAPAPAPEKAPTGKRLRTSPVTLLLLLLPSLILAVLSAHLLYRSPPHPLPPCALTAPACPWYLPRAVADADVAALLLAARADGGADAGVELGFAPGAGAEEARRAAELVLQVAGFPGLEYAEPWRVRTYAEGESVGPRREAVEEADLDDESMWASCQRAVTAVLFLTSAEGGAMVFPQAPPRIGRETVAATAGTVVVWYNVDAMSEQVDERAWYGMERVGKGGSVVATMHVRNCSAVENRERVAMGNKFRLWKPRVSLSAEQIETQLKAEEERGEIDWGYDDDDEDYDGDEDEVDELDEEDEKILQELEKKDVEAMSEDERELLEDLRERKELSMGENEDFTAKDLEMLRDLEEQEKSLTAEEREVLEDLREEKAAYEERVKALKASVAAAGAVDGEGDEGDEGEQVDEGDEDDEGEGEEEEGDKGEEDWDVYEAEWEDDDDDDFDDDDEHDDEHEGEHEGEHEVEVEGDAGDFLDRSEMYGDVVSDEAGYVAGHDAEGDAGYGEGWTEFEDAEFDDAGFDDSEMSEFGDEGQCGGERDEVEDMLYGDGAWGAGQCGGPGDGEAWEADDNFVPLHGGGKVIPPMDEL